MKNWTDKHTIGVLLIAILILQTAVILCSSKIHTLQQIIVALEARK